MSFQSFVTQQLASINSALNALATNAKRIFELPEQTTIVPSSWVHVDNNGTSQKLRIQKIISSIVQTYIDRLIYVGELTIDGNDVTVPEGVQALISNITYFTSEDFTFDIPFAEAGKSRIDIIVMNNLSQLVLVSGVEVEGIAVMPNRPPNTVIVTQINVTEDSFAAVDGILFKGEFDSVEQLEEAHPTALSGSSAIVNDGDDSFIYFYSLVNGWFTSIGVGGGSTPHNAKVNYSGADITVPTGFTGIITNLNDIYADVTFTVTGTALTVTAGASNGEILLINGKY